MSSTNRPRYAFVTYTRHSQTLEVNEEAVYSEYPTFTEAMAVMRHFIGDDLLFDAMKENTQLRPYWHGPHKILGYLVAPVKKDADDWFPWKDM